MRPIAAILGAILTASAFAVPPDLPAPDVRYTVPTVRVDWIEQNTTHESLHQFVLWSFDGEGLIEDRGYVMQDMATLRRDGADWVLLTERGTIRTRRLIRTRTEEDPQFRNRQVINHIHWLHVVWAAPARAEEP